MKYEFLCRIDTDTTPLDSIDLEAAFAGRSPAEMGSIFDNSDQLGGAVRADLHTALAIRKVKANEWSLDDACAFIRSFARGKL